jgi:hypothetical protein
MGNCSDISLVTQHYPIDGLVLINASCQSIVRNPLSLVLEDPDPRVYAAAVFDCRVDVTIASLIGGCDSGPARAIQLGKGEWLPLNDGYRATRSHGQSKRFPKHAGPSFSLPQRSPSYRCRD